MGRLRRRCAGLGAVALAAALGGALPGLAVAQPPIAPPDTPDQAADRVIVRYRPGVDGAARARVRRKVHAESSRALALARTELIRLPTGSSVSAAVRELEDSPDVEFAQPDYVHRPEAVPNDPMFGEQWSLNNTGQLIHGFLGTPDADIDAPEAWDATTGSDSVVVAVIDTGVNIDHVDLAPNVFSNPDETPGNGIDDDGNGRVDDVHGWDFVNDNDNVADDTTEHGTLVASILGARGDDGIGITGVAPRVKILPLQVVNSTGGLEVSAIVDAIAYARQMGADIVNMSFGSFDVSADPAEQQAIEESPAVLFSTSAGNYRTGTTVSDNDVTAHWPSNLTQDHTNVIASANTTNTDALSSSSSYGHTTVDLGSPGQILPGAAYSRRVFAEDFDEVAAGSLPAGWTTNGDWAATEETPITAPNALSDSPGGDYAPSSNTWAMSPAFSVPAGTTCAVKNFRMRATQSGADFFHTEYSLDDGATWTTIDTRDGSPGPGYLSAAPTFFTGPGTSARIRFRIEADADATTGDGVHIDNVEVRCSPSTEGYQLSTGTSLAAPLTAGAAALLLSRDPTLSPGQLKSTLRSTVDPLPSLAGKTISGGRLNLNRAVRSLDAPAASAAPADNVTDTSARLHATVTPAGSPVSWHFEYRRAGAGSWTSTSPVAGGEVVSEPVTTTIGNLSANTDYEFRVVAEKPLRRGESAIQTFRTSAPPPAIPPPRTRDTTAPVISRLVISPSAFLPLKRGALIARTRRGAVVRLRVSEPSRLAMRVLASRTGRRVGRSCALPSPSNRRARRCIRFVPIGSVAVNRVAGLVRRSLTGRVGGRALRSGSYRLQVTAIDAAGNRSEPAAARFRIARR